MNKKEKIAKHFKIIMETLGLDLNDESLKGTPDRVAKMYVDEIFYGLDKDNFPRIMTVSNGNNETVNYNQMLVVDNIKVSSMCEHHFQNIDGVCHIGYIPKNKVMGLSKFARVVDFFARKPQIQERLTEEIFQKLSEILETEDIAVVIKAKHFCMIARGVTEQNSETTTSRLGGAFLENNNTKLEFYNTIG